MGPLFSASGWCGTFSKYASDEVCRLATEFHHLFCNRLFMFTFFLPAPPPLCKKITPFIVRFLHAAKTFQFSTRGFPRDGKGENISFSFARIATYGVIIMSERRKLFVLSQCSAVLSQCSAVQCDTALGSYYRPRRNYHANLFSFPICTNIRCILIIDKPEYWRQTFWILALLHLGKHQKVTSIISK